jgi:hypothetical protein
MMKTASVQRPSPFSLEAPSHPFVIPRAADFIDFFALLEAPKLFVFSIGFFAKPIKSQTPTKAQRFPGKI